MPAKTSHYQEYYDQRIGELTRERDGLRELRETALGLAKLLRTAAPAEIGGLADRLVIVLSKDARSKQVMTSDPPGGPAPF